jgi:membrane protein required for colicin V production
LTLFDIIAGLLLSVSLIAGLMRGAVREVTFVVSFVLAAFLAIFSLRFTGPIAQTSVHPAWAGTGVAFAAVFIAAYFLFRIIGASLARSVDRTRALGTADRLIGGGFGLVRALVMLGLFALVMDSLTPGDRMPDWIRTAKLFPVAQASATALRVLAPRGAAAAQQIKPTIDKAVDDGVAVGTSTAVHKAKVIKTDEQAAAQKAMDDLVEKSR